MISTRSFGCPKIGADAGADRRVVGIHPLVPNRVVRLKERHVREPHLSAQQFRLVSAGRLKQPVDPLEYLPGLRPDVAGRVRCHTADVDQVAVHDDATDPRQSVVRFDDSMTNDVHTLFLLL
jgi:hypothetical protein